MFLVRWRDSSETWVKLADLKESHPVELAEYATARGISGEPAFAWWVPYTLRKRDVIISAVKSRLRKATHKYGVEIPQDVAHAIELDGINGNDHWQKAIEKEMYNAGVAFEILNDDQVAPKGWKQSPGTSHLM